MSHLFMFLKRYLISYQYPSLFSIKIISTSNPNCHFFYILEGICVYVCSCGVYSEVCKHTYVFRCHMFVSARRPQKILRSLKAVVTGVWLTLFC